MKKKQRRRNATVRGRQFRQRTTQKLTAHVRLDRLNLDTLTRIIPNGERTAEPINERRSLSRSCPRGMRGPQIKPSSDSSKAPVVVDMSGRSKKNAGLSSDGVRKQRRSMSRGSVRKSTTASTAAPLNESDNHKMRSSSRSSNKKRSHRKMKTNENRLLLSRGKCLQEMSTDL